jgi:hypothetical protein
MRVAVVAAILFLSGCATDKLSLVPPPGVNFTGQWQLNVAESDDPQHLLETANSQAAAASKDPGTGTGGARGGRGGGRSSAATGYPSAVPPATPPMAVVSEALSWPGKKVEIKQVAGVVAFTSDGKNRICQPTESDQKPHHHGSSDRDRRPSGRDVPPPICGWAEKTLIVQGGEADDERSPYEEHYSISEDGQRLVETVGFKGGRSNGFTLSRVWDRVAQ